MLLYNDIAKPFLLNSRVQGYLKKLTIYLNTMARGPMQLHRLHRLEAGPDYDPILVPRLIKYYSSMMSRPYRSML